MDHVTPNPDVCAEQHAYRTGHRVKILRHEGAKVACCGGVRCGIGWMNIEGLVRVVLPDIPLFDQD